MKVLLTAVPKKIDPEFFWWVIHKQYSKEKKDKFRSIKSKYPEKTHIIKSRRELNVFLENVIITSRREQNQRF